MDKTDDDGQARGSDLAFLDRLLTACGPQLSDLDYPTRDGELLTRDDLRPNPEALLREPGARVRLVRLFSRHRPTEERERVDGIDAIDVHKWPTFDAPKPLTNDVWRWRFIQGFRREVTELRRRVASPAAAPNPRIELSQAIARGAPEHGLPPTARSTFYRWVRNPTNRELLGLDKRLVKWAGQPVLVAGLLHLHASERRRTKLPARAPNAGRARKRKGRS